jgi:hypothetical protein
MLSPRIFINKLIGFALCIVDRMLACLSEEEDHVRRRRIRTAAILFEDSHWQSLVSLPIVALDSLYADCTPQMAGIEGLAKMARMFALHFGVTASITEERMPVSWFVNLETLFEECCRRAIAVAADQEGYRVSDWRAEVHHLLPPTMLYRADPDIVVWEGTIPIAVADPKYKDLADRQPANSDLYQILAHAKAWGVKLAELIYPSETTGDTPLGSSVDGIKVGAFFFDLRNPLESGRALLQMLLFNHERLVSADGKLA